MSSQGSNVITGTKDLSIAIVCSGLGHVQRGIEAWALALAEGLVREGKNVTLFGAGLAGACGGSGIRSAAPRVVALRCWKRCDPFVRWWTRLAPRFLWRWGHKSAYAFEQRSFARVFLRTIGPGDFDVIHSQDVALVAELENARRKGRLQTPAILAHGTDEDMETLSRFRYLQHLSPDYARRAREALVGRRMGERETIDARQDAMDSGAESGERRAETTNRDSRPSLRSLFSALAHNREPATDRHPRILHFCIPNFVDVEKFSPGPGVAFRERLGIPKGAFLVGCAAALKRGHKRVDALIREVSELRKGSGFGFQGSGVEGPDVCLILAGAETDETPEIARLAADLLGERCHILKNLSFEQMPDFYRALDLFVLPAPEEVFGICFLEAMACAVPVVAHNSPTLRWILGEDEEVLPVRQSTDEQDGLVQALGQPGGWCTDVGQEGFLARIWMEIHRDGVYRGKNGRRRVEQMFSWEAVSPAFLRMYEIVARDAAGRRRGPVRG